MSECNMSYKDTGVDYAAMDPHKRESLQAAASTDGHLARLGFSAVPWSRGESAFLVETPLGHIGFVVEGLGTKSLVADALCHIIDVIFFPDKSFYDQVAQCNVAMAVNDLITLGVRPAVYGQYLAVGSSSWFNDETRRHDLIEGTKKACDLARCTWGGGETPTLKGIIVPDTADLAGATWGIIPRKDQVINSANIRHGDAIVIIESSGIHANGLTLARSIAERKDGLWKKIANYFFPEKFPLRALPDGYLTKLPDGRTYGETLLDPTHIYVGLVEDCLNAGVHIHYAVNITGHGWRKLMRATQPFAYVIERLPAQLPIFDFIQKHGPVDDYEAYGNLNMGAGFALYVSKVDTIRVLEVADQHGIGAFVAGHIEESAEKKVIIKPKGLVYTSETLSVR